MDALTSFDRPLFKKLAHNDTGGAAGHQAGVVIPKALGPYFPDLEKNLASTSNPTVSEPIRALLFVGDNPVGSVETRYQYQTWNQTRSPERRLTSNLASFLKSAHQDDYLIIQRSVGDPSLYKLRLIKAGSKDYANVAKLAGSRNWGPLYLNDAPIKEVEFETELTAQEARQNSSLALFDNSAVFNETRTLRIARSRAFQKIVTQLYGQRCAVCGQGLISPLQLAEVEAAHIVSRSLKGADDARNGLSLCRSHHWAFDRGLFGVDTKRSILIPPKVSALPQNSALAAFAGQKLIQPVDTSLQPVPEAFEWHMKEIVNKLMQ